MPDNGFDLSTAPDHSAIEDEGQVVVLRNVLDDPMTYVDTAGNTQPVTWTVRGTFSATYRRVIEQQKRAVGKRIRRGEDVIEATDGNELAAMVACTVAWAGFMSGGQPLPCTPENVRAVLSSPKAQHIVEQVRRAMGDHEAFFTKDSSV